MSVVYMLAGVPTPGGATFAVRVDGGGPVRVAVADNAGMDSPMFTASEAVDADGLTKVSIDGLAASTQHWWQVEDNGVIDTSVTGRFRTAPAPGSRSTFMFTVAGDAGAGDSGFVTDRVSNHPVHDVIRQADPEFHVHPGDWGYRDIGSGVHVPAPFDEADYLDAYHDNLTFNGDGTSARQAQLWRNVPLGYVWDNHDFGFTTGSSIDSDGTLPHKAAARTAYRKAVPHPPLPAGSGDNPIYHDFRWDRLHVVMLDCRSERSPNSDPDGPSKTMLGSAQKAWLDNLLATSDAEVLCVVSSGQWLTQDTESDTWNAYSTERDELVQMFGDHGWLPRMFMLTASMHALGLDSGGGNRWGGFPVLAAAALDAGGSPVNDLYDQGPTDPGPGRYGRVEVADLGTSILVTLSGWHYDTGLWRSYRFGIAADSPSMVARAQVHEFDPIVRGSHDVVVEARVVTEFTSGPEPAGIELPILGGDVQMDATAQVLATLSLTIQGIDPQTGKSWFPRQPGDLLQPYGNEIFVRRGVDIGSKRLFAPLGYFRIETVEQSEDIENAIVISGSDRMAAIVEADVLTPTEFAADATVGEFFAALVRRIYPAAVILFDDDAGLQELGRTIVVDESSYEPLLEVADGIAKVLEWDGEGILRVESPPPDDELVWTVDSGRHGVMVRASRRVTRIGAPNGVIVIGEGGGTDKPIRAIAVDRGEKSPTRWGGPYGKVPHTERLATVRTQDQGDAAARELLRRQLGTPHSADFGASVNPAMRPRMPGLVRYRDGNRDNHVLQTLTIPLLAEDEMSGTTRERMQISIGSVIGS